MTERKRITLNPRLTDVYYKILVSSLPATMNSPPRVVDRRDADGKKLPPAPPRPSMSPRYNEVF